MLLHVTNARHVGDYRIEVSFNDGRTGIADIADVLSGPMFTPLRDPSVFAQFRLDRDLATIVWPNGADLAPECLYFHAFKGHPELREQFRKWGYAA
ncbi:MAG: DUF2442 domain-containing protein [Thiotrichales bacterium]